jgi:HPt (histidine-containing phosphotransfer) domain-containing protein
LQNFLFAVLGDDADAGMVELIHCYLSEPLTLLHGIHAAAAAEGAIALNHVVHTLKASSASLDAVPLANLCQALEAASREGVVPKDTNKMQQLEPECERVKLVLQQEC